MEKYNITPLGCLCRFAIIFIAEFVTSWICIKVLNLDEGMTLLIIICVFILIMIGAFIFDKYANPYSKRFFANNSKNKSKMDDVSAVCPYCYHINYVVDDEGYCKCENCGNFFQKQEYDPQ